MINKLRETIGIWPWVMFFVFTLLTYFVSFIDGNYEKATADYLYVITLVLITWRIKHD